MAVDCEKCYWYDKVEKRCTKGEKMRVENKKNGKLYTVVGVVNNANNTSNSDDNEQVLYYSEESNLVYVRSLHEFVNRFESEDGSPMEFWLLEANEDARYGFDEVEEVDYE